jgi:hypothetical protein
MTPALQRATRTFLQAFVGSLAGANLLALSNTEGVVDWSEARKVVLAAFMAGVVAVVSFAHNALEDGTALPALLKPQPEAPIPPAPILEDKPPIKKAPPKKATPRKAAAKKA